MRALVFGGEGRVALREVPDPRIQRGDEVLLRVEATGICGTDLHIVSGRYAARPGVILGHETTATVLEVGAEVRRVAPGDRVVLDPTYHCGACALCRSDRPNYCEEKATTETGVSSDGTYAEHHVAREAFLHRLPEELSFAEGTLTEPLACCLHALRQVRFRPDTRALVVGAGPMGLLFTTALQAMGLDVVIGDVAPYRLERATDIAGRARDLRGGIDEALGAARFDLVVDTSGRMLDKILPRVERGGDVLLAGLDDGYEAAVRPAYLTDNGIRLVGSIDTDRTFPPALALLRRAPAMRRIVTHEYPLSAYEEAFTALGVRLGSRARGPIQATKVVLRPW